ncbi:MAG: DUF3243 domain-containing protein [Desulfotomaculaceae bacterium]|nr:DUF3243 domain-containing protein [Desulfotomaculaceae bacterium]
MEIDTSWHDWKRTLGKAVNAAEFVGMSDKMINKFAYQIGNFLASKIDPANREQHLLKELWEVGTEEEKRILAKMIAKLVDQSKLH